jgi:hypothetical protein
MKKKNKGILMFLKKNIRVISLLVCISTTTCVKSERPALWISVMTAGYVVSTVIGGILGAYFPSPVLNQNGVNGTCIVSAVTAGGAYLTLLGIVTCAKMSSNGVGCCT